MAEKLCGVCHRPEEDHAGLNHTFNMAGALRPREVQRSPEAHDRRIDPGQLGNATKGDPVLRMALIRKGVITPEDLDAVEAELKVSGLAWAPPSSVVES